MAERKFEQTWTIEEFIENNMNIYCDKYLQEYPQNAHKINDGDLEHVMDWIDEKDVIDKMTEVYKIFNSLIT